MIGAIRPGAAPQTASSGTVQPLALTLKVGLDDALALLFPLENGAWRPAYTHKSAGMHAAGVAVWQGAEHDLAGAPESPAPPLVDADG